MANKGSDYTSKKKATVFTNLFYEKEERGLTFCNGFSTVYKLHYLQLKFQLDVNNKSLTLATQHNKHLNVGLFLSICFCDY